MIAFRRPKPDQEVVARTDNVVSEYIHMVVYAVAVATKLKYAIIQHINTKVYLRET